MKKQTKKSSQEPKKFGRYDFITEFRVDGGDGIIINGNVAGKIRSRLYEYEQLKDTNEIIFLDINPNIHKTEFSKSYYHVKDSAIELGNGGCDVYESYLIIYNKNPTKRQETRKFLEEILK